MSESCRHCKFLILNLLVGIKDTNDVLVSSTLRALADVVPILGSSVVIGGKSRKKFFADGRPKAPTARSSAKNHGHRNSKSNKHIENETGNIDVSLPERASPDGGEDLNSPNYTASEEETENWTDWENTADDTAHSDKIENDSHELEKETHEDICDTISEDSKLKQGTSSVSAASSDKSTVCSNKVSSLPDISELDIKNSKTNGTSSTSVKSKNNSSSNCSYNVSKEIDYFQDMEPVIVTSTKHIVSDALSPSSMAVTNSSKFEINDEDTMMNEAEGWGDDVEDVNWTADEDNSCKVDNAVITSGDT